MSSLRPFTREEHSRIDAAIAEIERGTTADLCVVVTRVSDRYSLYPIAWAAIAAILLGGIVCLIRPETASRILILIQLSSLIVLTLLFEWLSIRLAIVPERVKHAHARQLAHREFVAHAAGGKRNVVLLFVSLGERYVEIVADHETHALAPPGVWNKIVDEFLATVKDGRVADGVLGAAAACGDILKTHHPLSS